MVASFHLLLRYLQKNKAASQFFDFLLNHFFYVAKTNSIYGKISVFKLPHVIDMLVRITVLLRFFFTNKLGGPNKDMLGNFYQ